MPDPSIKRRMAAPLAWLNLSGAAKCTEANREIVSTSAVGKPASTSKMSPTARLVWSTKFIVVSPAVAAEDRAHGPKDDDAIGKPAPAKVSSGAASFTSDAFE